MDDNDFSWGVFWLQLHNVPFRFMNEKVEQILGSKEGFVEEVESQKNRVSWNRWLRARVRVRVSSQKKGVGWLFMMVAEFGSISDLRNYRITVIFMVI